MKAIKLFFVTLLLPLLLTAGGYFALSRFGIKLPESMVPYSMILLGGIVGLLLFLISFLSYRSTLFRFKTVLLFLGSMTLGVIIYLFPQQQIATGILLDKVMPLKLSVTDINSTGTTVSVVRVDPVLITYNKLKIWREGEQFYGVVPFSGIKKRVPILAMGFTTIGETQSAFLANILEKLKVVAKKGGLLARYPGSIDPFEKKGALQSILLTPITAQDQKPVVLGKKMIPLGGFLVGYFLLLLFAPLFLKEKAAPVARERHGHTKVQQGIFNAIELGKAGSVKKHLLTGSSHDIRNDDHQTPLMYAALRGKMNVLRLLIREGGDLKSVDQNGNTCLILAASRGELNALKMLVKHHAPLRANNYVGQNMIIAAAASGNLNVVQYVVSLGFDVNYRDQKGRTPLMRAAWSGSIPVVKYLLKKGAEKNAKNYSGHTAYEIAYAKGYQKVMKLLA